MENLFSLQNQIFRMKNLFLERERKKERKKVKFTTRRQPWFIIQIQTKLFSNYL